MNPLENEKNTDSLEQEDAKTECTTVVIPNHMKRLPPGTFAGYWNLSSVEIPTSVRYVHFDFAVTCEKLSEIKVEKDHPMFISDNGILYDKRMKKLIRCPQGKRGIVTIPEGVEIIAQGAFSRCNRIPCVHLPSTLKTIDSGAFALCENLISIEIPQQIDTISRSAFFF